MIDLLASQGNPSRYWREALLCIKTKSLIRSSGVSFLGLSSSALVTPPWLLLYTKYAFGLHSLLLSEDCEEYCVFSLFLTSFSHLVESI